MSSVQDRYLANYQKIANDHVRHWRQTGKNPFQTERAVTDNEQMTVQLVTEHGDPNSRLLDAGCGMGDLMLRFPDHKTEGAEIATAYLEVAQERKLKVHHANLEFLPFDSNSFDIITCTDVLEHVLDVNAVVRELARVLRYGGTIVVRVPDNEPVAWHDQGYEFVHLRVFDEGTLRLLFEKVFDMPVLACVHDGNSLHLAARKRP